MTSNLVTELAKFAQHSDLCAVSQWMPADTEDFDCPQCNCGLGALLEQARQGDSIRSTCMEPGCGRYNGEHSPTCPRSSAETGCVGCAQGWHRQSSYHDSTKHVHCPPRFIDCTAQKAAEPRDVDSTPRVDAEAKDGWSGDACAVSYEFACSLERENNYLRMLQAMSPQVSVLVGPSAVDCFDAVNALIKPGNLGGNGSDKTAERNGLVLAANTIAALIHPSQVKTEREPVRRDIGLSPVRAAAAAKLDPGCPNYAKEHEEAP